MKLSIIIPYHNTLELTQQLLDVLIPQLTNECELIIVDDDVNTYEVDVFVENTKDIWNRKANIRIIHHTQNSGGASKPRNTGLDNAIGEYITFIDSDDLISGNYIEKILTMIKDNDFDYCFFSWKFIGQNHDEVIITDYPPQWNCSVWNCIYKRETIGDNRFNETMRIAEDYDFNVRVRKGKKANIEQVLYFYNDSRKGSIMNG